MLKIRIIPILTFNGFGLVKTRQFSNPRMLGNPVQTARVYNSRGVDELVFTDIFASEQNRKMNMKLVADVIRECFMPVAIGGAVSSLDDISSLLKIGADKVVIKSEAIKNPQFVKQAAEFFGAQCITIAVDVKRDAQGVHRIYGKNLPELNAAEFMEQMQEMGAGEFVLTAVDHDGEMQGFDIPVIKELSRNIKIPFIAVGGAGSPDHFVELFQQVELEAAGASSIFHFTQYTPHDIKLCLKAIDKPVRL